MFEELCKVFDVFQEYKMHRDFIKNLSALELEVFTESKAIQIDNDVSFMTLEELEKEIDEIDRENKYQST